MRSIRNAGEPGPRRYFQNSTDGIVHQGGRWPGLLDLIAPPRNGGSSFSKICPREGLTDYIVHSIPFVDGGHKALSPATSRCGGFGANELARLEAMIPAVAFNLSCGQFTQESLFLQLVRRWSQPQAFDETNARQGQQSDRVA
jgi:hypothetical protein